MSRGEHRNAELSRAALVVVAGGTLVGISQRAPGVDLGPAAAVLLVVGGIGVVIGLVLAIRSFRRSGGADR